MKCLETEMHTRKGPGTCVPGPWVDFQFWGVTREGLLLHLVLRVDDVVVLLLAVAAGRAALGGAAVGVGFGGDAFRAAGGGTGLVHLLGELVADRRQVLHCL